MKPLYIFILTLCLYSFSEKSFGQDYLEFPNEGIWEFEYWVDPGIYIETMVIYVEGDTLIDGQHYTPVFSVRYNDSLYTEVYRGAVRKDEKRVWIVPKDSLSEYLLYDFSAEVGDTLRDVFRGDTLHTWVVENIDEVNYFDNEHRQWHLSNLQDECSYYWYEGIGFSDFWFSSLDESCGFFSSYFISCFVRNGTPYYGNCITATNEIPQLSNIIKLYPNPAQNRLNIEYPNNQHQIQGEVFDMYGNFVQGFIEMGTKVSIDIQDLSKGVYVLKIQDIQGEITQKFIKL